MPRLFAALPLPETVRLRLSLLSGGVPGARFVPPETFHITLAFIGEVDNPTADDAVSALETVRVSAFDVEISGLGTFGEGRQPRNLHAVVRPSRPLETLHDRIRAVLARVPGLTLERRRFVPHVTLARLQRPDMDRLGDLLEGNNLLHAGPWRADRFALYSSHLGKEGPDYRVEQVFALGA